jgi:hypothetical protein
MNLDGTDDYYAVPTFPPPVSTSKVTLLVVAKSAVAPAQWDFIAGRTLTTSWNEGYGFFFDSATTIKFFVGVYSADFAEATVVPTSWNQYVGTYDGNDNIGLYVNGRFVDAGVRTLQPIATVAPLEIGRGSDNTYNLNGSISHVYLWNRVLSTGEIEQLYREPFTFIETPKLSRLFSPTAAPTRITNPLLILGGE